MSHLIRMAGLVILAVALLIAAVAAVGLALAFLVVVRALARWHRCSCAGIGRMESGGEGEAAASRPAPAAPVMSALPRRAIRGDSCSGPVAALVCAWQECGAYGRSSREEVIRDA